MTEEVEKPTHSRIRIAIVIAVVAMLLVAAGYVLLYKPIDDGGGPGPEGAPIEMTTLSAKWEELSLTNLPPTTGDQFLWVQVKVKNLEEMPFDIVAMEFAAEGGDGVRFNATEDDSAGTIDPGAQATFNLSIEVSSSTWAPKEMAYNYSGGAVTSLISTPTPLVHDIVFSGVTYVLNSTDNANQTHTTDQVLHVTFGLKNQWTSVLLTYNVYFAAKDVGGASYIADFKSGPDSLQPGATGSYDLEFLVSLTFNPGSIAFQMPMGPYGSVTI